jgi:hypothetical protein
LLEQVPQPPARPEPQFEGAVRPLMPRRLERRGGGGRLVARHPMPSRMAAGRA